jgi:signal transduction histidine kinase/DNA-binding response OmpR family regulator
MNVSIQISLFALTACLTAVTLAYVAERRHNRRLRAEFDRAMRDAAEHQNALLERKHLDTMKDEFIATVSHELRTPLTSIRGALGLLSSGVLGQLDSKAANLLRIATTNTDRLVRLISDMLDLERMDSGQAVLDMQRCSLRDLVKQAVDTMNPLATNNGVRIDIVPEHGSQPTNFDGDPDRIQQVLCNLLSNAIKFSPRGSTVRVLSGADRNDLILRVEDSGRGVPADKLETIFGRFSQVEVSDARQKGGSGLGLAICRSILAQHGGVIWAERNDSAGADRPGTTLVVRVPRSAAAEGVLPLPVQAEGSILIVDDDPGVRHVVAEQLRRNGYSVLEADRGETALSIVRHHPIEAILLDLYMPGLSGWDTLQRLRSDHSGANIPVVILSVLSPAVSNEENSSVLSSAQGWIQKPFNEGLLLAELGRVLHSGDGPSRILLVEDDEDLATVVLSGFENSSNDEDVRIEHVTSLVDAKLACQAEAPDILILDLTLPDGSGFALVDWLREQPSLRTLPLVVYSGRDASASEMEELRLGPTQFLAKGHVQPNDVEELVLSMVRHLRKPMIQPLPA